MMRKTPPPSIVNAPWPSMVTPTTLFGTYRPLVLPDEFSVTMMSPVRKTYVLDVVIAAFKAAKVFTKAHDNPDGQDGMHVPALVPETYPAGHEALHDADFASEL